MNKTTGITLVPGGISTDHRGSIFHVNGLDMSEVKRFYIIHQRDTFIVRAWHAHQTEKKWFYAVKGSFTLALVKIDDWENPSLCLNPEVFRLSALESKVVCVPEGYANGIKAEEPDSILMVFSNKTLQGALGDSWRYDSRMWMDWEAAKHD